jgi:hypothetical protein
LHERALIVEGGRIPIAKYAAFFELAADGTGDVFPGLHFGQTRDTRDSGLIGYIGLSSPTVMEVIENTKRYCRVLSEAVEIETSELPLVNG